MSGHRASEQNLIPRFPAGGTQATGPVPFGPPLPGTLGP